MVVARYSHGQLVIIDRLREMVRLAAGVEENGRIDKEIAARACWGDRAEAAPELTSSGAEG